MLKHTNNSGSVTFIITKYGSLTARFQCLYRALEMFANRFLCLNAKFIDTISYSRSTGTVVLLKTDT